MQLDADDEDEPFFKPQPIKTEPLLPRPAADSGRGAEGQSREGGAEPVTPATTDQRGGEGRGGVDQDEDDRYAVAAKVAAATVTAELEE